jgi:hypothetical protein
MRKMIAALVLLAPLGASAVSRDGRATPTVKGAGRAYIVQLADDPAVTYGGGRAGLPATRPGQGRKLDPNDANVRRYVAFLEGQHQAALGAVGASTAKFYDYRYSFNGFAATLTPAQVRALLRQPGVVAVTPDSLRRPATHNTPSFLGLSGGGGLWDQLGGQGAAGEDVVVGVIDTGIWPEHPSFSDQLDLADRPGASGKRTQAYGPPPAGWHGACQAGEQWNTDDCNNKLIGARYFLTGYGHFGVITDDYLSPRDADGHGTHTASTAAGNGGVEALLFGRNLGTGPLSGMAPRARVAAYKACWNGDAGGCATSDLVAAIDTAVADGVDVINYSIGSDTPALLNPDAVSFLFAADAGVYVSVSNGNAGPGAGTTGSPAATPWVTAVGASTHSATFANTVTLGNGASYVGASVTPGVGPAPLVDAAAAGSELCLVGQLDPAVVTGRIVLCKRGTNARVEKSLAVKVAGGIGMVLYNAVGAQAVVTDNHYVPSTHIAVDAGLEVKAYVASAGAAATATLSPGTATDDPSAPSMADFSSRGPNGASPDVIKPDVTAPGVNVLAGASPTPLLGAPGQLFQSISGTSMSSPHNAGSGALLVQLHPDWTPAMVKSALMTTAHQAVNKEDFATAADPFDIGAGHISPTPAADPGLVYDAGFVDYLRYLCGERALSPSGATCKAVGSIDPSDLNLPSFGVASLAGVQTVTRTVTNVGAAGTYAVLVDAPPGIDVSVSPASFTIAAGGTESYEVTFTTQAGATFDAWSFGALTWSDGSHSVRSPIAVKPVALAAPAEVSGTGTSGSLDYAIRFGYGGTFETASHGLVPATTTAGHVVDDPANDIEVALVTGVGVTEHEFAVPAGTRHLRFATFDGQTDGADDLDLYLYDPDGNLVDGSGSPTAQEQVDAAFPAAGTWTVVVHGWQTDGADSNYTLFGWMVGDADAGNMTVTAPGTAVQGATATVTVSWSGLTAGGRYLGAVSYGNGTDEIGSTLVSIATGP